MSENIIVVEWLRQQAKALRWCGPRMASSSVKFDCLSSEVCEAASQACEAAASVLVEAADEIEKADV